MSKSGTKEVNNREISKRLRNLLILFLLMIVFLYSASLYSNIPSVLDSFFLQKLMMLTGISIFLFGLYLRNTIKNFRWVSILVFFLLSYIIVHFQLPFLNSMGYELNSDYLNWFIWADNGAGNKATLVSLLGLIAFFFGYILVEFKKSEKRVPNTIYRKYKNPVYFSFLIILSYTFYIVFFITSGSYKYGYYAAGDEMVISRYFFTGFNNSLIALLVLKLYYINILDLKQVSLFKYINLFGSSTSILVFWHIIFSLFVGDRGPVLMFGLLYFGLYFIRWKRLKLIYLLLGIFVVSMIFSVLSKVRVKNETDASFTDRISTVLSSQEVNDNNFNAKQIPLSQTIELAFSGRCLNHVVSNVPSKYNYGFGYFQMQQIIAGIPFMSKYYLRYLGNGERKYDGSSNFISYLIQGNYPTYGDGRNTSADLYLDFGVYGVVLGLFLFGFFVKKADTVLFDGGYVSVLFWLAILIYFAGAIYIGRSSLLIFFQRIVQVYLIIILNRFFYNIIKFRNADKA